METSLNNVINLQQYRVYRVLNHALSKYHVNIKFKHFDKLLDLSDELKNEKITFGIFLDKIRHLK